MVFSKQFELMREPGREKRSIGISRQNLSKGAGPIGATAVVGQRKQIEDILGQCGLNEAGIAFCWGWNRKVVLQLTGGVLALKREKDVCPVFHNRAPERKAKLWITGTPRPQRTLAGHPAHSRLP